MAGDGEHAYTNQLLNSRIAAGQTVAGAVYQPADTPFYVARMARGASMPVPTVEDTGRSTTVFISASQWVAQCVFCGGAQVAFRTVRKFFCSDCLHNDDSVLLPRHVTSNGGKWYATVWPSAANEAALDASSIRSWKPGDPIP